MNWTKERDIELMAKNKDLRTILAVDDMPENIDILDGFLSESYNLKVANNGVVALKIAQSNPHPDLILLDINMPGMDGFEVCESLKADASTEEIPVIFVTGEIKGEDITKGFNVGAVDYVIKPFNPEELDARISNHLDLKDGREKLKRLSEQLGKYLSPSVYSSIVLGDRDVAIGANRKIMTVCFTDLVDFTNTAENMQHEELSTWLNNYLNKMAHITLKHGGTLDKFIGDSVMVFFGDPETEGIEADAVKCIEMCKEMITEAKKMNIEVRAGINTGMCTVGNFGSDDRMEYSIIGKEVNVASRLESNSFPGKILISESTYELVKDHFECNPEGNMEAKGIDRKINTYQLDF